MTKHAHKKMIIKHLKYLKYADPGGVCLELSALPRAAFIDSCRSRSCKKKIKNCKRGAFVVFYEDQ